jgi:hypothetical protein
MENHIFPIQIDKVVRVWNQSKGKEIILVSTDTHMHKQCMIMKFLNRCVVNATNAPALSQSFKAMFNLFQFQGG